MKSPTHNTGSLHSLGARGGFTLVETLVAITILMIAIAGPLVISSQALTTSISSRDQSIASYLAQEEMEIVKNIRDNTIANPTYGMNDWLHNFSSCLPPTNGPSNNYCDVSVSNLGGLSSSMPPQTIYPCNSVAYCQLYLTSNGYDDVQHDGTASPFHRAFRLTKINNNSLDYQVTVIVSWNEGTVPNSVILNSELTANSRD